MVEAAVKECKACQLTSGQSNPMPIASSDFPSNPWEVLAIDFHGPMRDGSELMVLIDEHSKFPVIVEVKSTASIHVLPKLDSIFSLMGIPKILKSDNGPPFQGHEFAEFCRNLGVKHRKITPLWPQANGQVENFNKSIKQIIQKSFVSNSDWRSELNKFLRAYRNTPHSSTKVAPSDLLFIKSNSSKLPSIISDQKEGDIQIKAKMNDSQKKATMKAYSDVKRRAKPTQFRVRDQVVLDQHFGKKMFNKYEARFMDKVMTIKNIKGSMITVEDKNGHCMTRNCVFFKTATPNTNNDGELETLPCSQGQSASQARHISTTQSPSSTNETAQSNSSNQGIQSEAKTRASSRTRIPIVRFEAGPASGLYKNRQNN